MPANKHLPTETNVAVIAMITLFAFIGFFAWELSQKNGPDLSKLGAAGLVALVAGALYNPDQPAESPETTRESRAEKGHGGIWAGLWWVLLTLSGLGTIASAILLNRTDFPAAPPALAAYAAMFVGLLVDGSKWTLPKTTL